MKRLFTLSLTVLLATAWSTAVLAQSPKRGFGENNLGYLADMQALAKGCTWWYNWGGSPNNTHEQYLATGEYIEFVPMAWNGSYNVETFRTYYKSHPNDKYLLGFNEPNFKAQSNMTPTQAAEQWPALEALADELGLKLVAPALNYPDGAINDGVKYQPEEWMDGFIAAYKERNGGKEPRMDYLALHCYMDQPDALISFVENFAKRYNKQVWLTEFCAWEAGNLTADTQLSTMVKKLALLEQSEWVFRYAWFKARNANVYPYYNLVEYPNSARNIPAGTYTKVGFAYVHMSTFNKEKYYAPGEVIPVNEFVDFNNIKDIQWGLDPQTRDSVEVGMQGTGLSLTYQIDVPEAGAYKLLLRAARPSGSASLKARINILDGEGNTLVSKYTMEPGEDTLTYVPYVFDLTLPAGKQTLTIQKDNARACNLSLIKFAKSFAADDKDLVAAKGTPRTTGTNNNNNHSDDDHKGDGNWGNDNVKVTDAKSEPFRFDAKERFYAIYLDETTRAKNGITNFVNLGDNGGSQNSYNWSDTYEYADITGANSFGVTGNYVALTVKDQGWSGLGYNINAAQGDLDLSGINQDYGFHMAVKSTSDKTIYFYLTDGKGHVARLLLGDDYWTEVPQGAGDQHKFIPVANFKRDGEWHNIDIPMSYLTSKYGLNFAADTDYDGNLFCVMAGGTAGTDVAFDAVFFHGPADSKPDTAASTYDLTVSDASEKPFNFSKSDRYYVIQLDGNTKQANLSESQIVDCGPNGTNRQLYPWADTFTFPEAADENSFGVGSAYLNCKVGNAGWSGLGYFVGGSDKPLNLTGINDDFTLHFAVKTTYTGTLEFELVDAMGNAGWIVLGDGDGTFEGHKILGNFPRDGKWHNIDVPVKLLANEWAVNFSTSANFTGNFFCFLAGGTANAEVGVDAIFIYGPEESAKATEIETVATLDDRAISVAKVSEKPFVFPTDKDYDYYVLFLDGETMSQNIPAEHLIYLGDNGTTQNCFPWAGTLAGDDPVGANSFGVTGGYMAWSATDQGWLGLGYNIAPSAGRDLSGITGEYTLHFAVKSTSPVNYHYTVVDGNGKSCYLNLGPDDAWEDNSTIKPIGDFERNDTWYNVDVPVSYLIQQGLDFSTANPFRAGNLFNITAAGTTINGTEHGIIAGTPVDYDAVFFYGPARKANAIGNVSADAADDVFVRPALRGVYDLTGRRVADSLTDAHLTRGIYIVAGKKVFVK